MHRLGEVCNSKWTATPKKPATCAERPATAGEEQAFARFTFHELIDVRLTRDCGRPEGVKRLCSR